MDDVKIRPRNTLNYYDGFNFVLDNWVDAPSKSLSNIYEESEDCRATKILSRCYKQPNIELSCYTIGYYFTHSMHLSMYKKNFLSKYTI